MSEIEFNKSGITIGSGLDAIQFKPVNKELYEDIAAGYHRMPKFLGFDIYNGDPERSDERIGYLDLHFNGAGLYSIVDVHQVKNSDGLQESYATSIDSALPVPIDRAFLNLKGLLVEIAVNAVRMRKRNAKEFAEKIATKIIGTRTDREWEKLDMPLIAREPVPGGTT